MITINPQYITDNSGKKISAVLPMKDFKKILEELEDFEDIRLYDDGKRDSEPSILADDAFKKIEIKRKKLK